MSPKQMTWRDAIVKVLKDAGTPLHYTDITECILAQELRANVGATPSNTVYANLRKEIHKEVFEWIAPGIFRLRGGSNLDHGEDNSDDDSGGPIMALGMFWERDLVDWTKKPKIFGVQQDGAAPVDMAEQTGIYLLYDFRDIVYAGRTTSSRLGSRLSDHTRDRLKTRWNRFSWFGFRAVKDDGTLDGRSDSYELSKIIPAMEALLIEALEPPQNRRGGDGFKGIEYIQVEDQEKKEQKFKLIEGILKSG